MLRTLSHLVGLALYLAGRGPFPSAIRHDMRLLLLAATATVILAMSLVSLSLAVYFALAVHLPAWTSWLILGLSHALLATIALVIVLLASRS